VASQGLRAIQWDVSSGDPSAGLTAEHMVRAVVANVRPGSIVLFHANGRGWKTAKALPRIIDELRSQEFEFVTVSKLIDVPGATLDIRPICFDNRPGDTNRYDLFARGLMQQYKDFTDRMSRSPPVPPTPIPATRPARSEAVPSANQ
jgi:hypothetical protein